MSNSRTVSISIDHIISELAAVPLCSRSALEGPLIAIDPAMSGSTRRLWRKTEAYFTSHFPHVSLDELISIRNSVWFGDQPGGPNSLPHYLKRLASKWLVSRGANAEPKIPGGSRDQEGSDPAARRAWRWMTFAMPSDLLLAGLSREGRGPVRVNVLAPSVEALLRDGGYAETHLHLGAALDFSTAWASGMNLAGRSAELSHGMAWDAFSSPGADHDEGRMLAQWLVRAAIVRYFLGAFLAARKPTVTFASYLKEVGKWLKGAFIGTDSVPIIRRAFSDLLRGNLTMIPGGSSEGYLDTFTAMQNAYNALTHASTYPLPEKLDDVQAMDPLAEFYHASGHSGPSIQLQFLWQGMQRLEEQPSERLFAMLFWQVERVRGQIYRHCIQRPLTPGLMNFIRFYDRKGAVTGPLENVELESAAVLGGMGHGLRSLEVRASPQSDYDSQLKTLHHWRDRVETLKTDEGLDEVSEQRRRNGHLQAKAWEEAEFGVVLHYLKFRGKQADRGNPQAFDVDNLADPGAAVNSNHYRWQDFTTQTEKNASAIADAVAHDPDVLYFLRGLDVCRDEHGVPTWVIAPMFSHVQSQVAEITQQHRCAFKPEMPRLRTTVHVGEDFVHLATGLRYMDEAIEQVPLECGDRVGHGLALGVEPELWAERAMRLAMPCEDRWLDLIWERTWHGQHESRFTADRRTFVDDEIVRLSNKILGEDYTWTPRDAAQIVAWLRDPKQLQMMGFPDGMLPDEPLSALSRQFERYLTEPSLYRRGRVTEWVAVQEDGPAVAELQRLVRLRYATTGITIEVNPISNLLVGDLTDLNSHPLWRISPGLGHDVDSTLRICVGSDDPFPFATCLPEEYQFLFDSLVLAGRSQAEARTWLEHIRQLGMESRFTMPAHNR